jgi:uncharacterized membrane protein
MSQNLIVVGFHGKHRASEVLGQLEQVTYDWALDLKDAVAAYRTDDGRLRVDQSVQPTTKEGAGWGAFIGGMIGALLAAPFTAGLSTAAAATTLGFGAATMGTAGGAMGADDAATFKREYGISDEFVKEVGGMIAPGDSAVFAVISGGNAEQVGERFRGYGGTILKTSLSPRAAERVQETIRA